LTLEYSNNIYINPKKSASLLPKSNGVYIFKDKDDQIVYVGKAKNLKSRVSSYFTSKETRAIRIKNEIYSIDFILSENEEDALILENDLIKKNKPKLNVRLKDDKSFPFIKININEDFPQFFVTRNHNEDGGKYFGPYANASNVRKTLNQLSKLFPYRSCAEKLPFKLCMDFHIKRGKEPCSSDLNKIEYMKVVKQTISFLEGNTKETISSLKKSMWEASKSQSYEKAALIRDNISAIESIFEKQSVITSKNTNLNLDVFDVASNNVETWVDVMQVRSGKIKTRDHFQMEVQDFHDNKLILSSFIKSYYLKNNYPPKEILVSNLPSDKTEIEEFLKIKFGKKILISIPKKGSKKEVASFVSKNLKRWIEYRENRLNDNEEATTKSLIDIKNQLKLNRKPKVIECFDISHIQGTSVVASMVVFDNGRPDKSKYRRFELKNSQKNDDYSALKEIFTRRLKRLEDENVLPDLMLVDGGKGQLNATNEILKQSIFKDIKIASIAKQKEEIFIPERKESIILKNGSYGKHLIQRIRDEAHRFAVEYHRKKRSRKMVSSELDSVEGIGPKKKKSLMLFFGSIKNIRNSSIEELLQVKGINRKDAEKIKDLIN